MIKEYLQRTDQYGQHYYSSRPLAKLLDYYSHKSFRHTIMRAQHECLSHNQLISHHFEKIMEPIKIGKDAVRFFETYKLSLFACYLVLNNANPEKPITRLAHSYFSHQKATNIEISNNETSAVILSCCSNNRLNESAPSIIGVLTPYDFAHFYHHNYERLT